MGVEFKYATNAVVAGFKKGENKIKVTATHYAKNPHVSVRHFLDVYTAKVIAYEILQSTFQESFKNGFIDRKGTVLSDMIEARVFRLEHKNEGKFPYIITISNGRGKIIGKGAIAMTQVEREVMFPMSYLDAKRLSVFLLEGQK